MMINYDGCHRSFFMFEHSYCKTLCKILTVQRFTSKPILLQYYFFNLVRFDFMSISHAYATILTEIGEDLNRAGLKDTPQRAAKAFQYLTSGYQQDLAEVTNDAVFPSDNREMVLVKNIEFYSLCEHHLLPFYGRVHIAYLPEGQVLGLSKFARITEMFARRLQIQENLTQQIAQAVQDITKARGVAVVIDSAHMCMMMRGVGKQCSTTRTVAYVGEFKENSSVRQEFLMAVPEQAHS